MRLAEPSMRESLPAEGRPTVGVPPRENLLTVHQVAAQWGVSERTVRRLIATGRLRCIRIGRLVRIDPGDVSRWLSARKE